MKKRTLFPALLLSLQFSGGDISAKSRSSQVKKAAPGSALKARVSGRAQASNRIAKPNATLRALHTSAHGTSFTNRAAQQKVGKAAALQARVGGLTANDLSQAVLTTILGTTKGRKATPQELSKAKATLIQANGVTPKQLEWAESIL